MLSRQSRSPEEDAKWATRIDNVRRAREAILADLLTRAHAGDPKVYPLRPENDYRWKKPQVHYYSGAGSILCPICKTSTLAYSRASSNGHIMARCSSLNCVSWME